MGPPNFDRLPSDDFDRAEFESLFDEGELDVDKQIEQLRECVNKRNRETLLEKITIGTYLSGNAAALEIRDDMVGLPPALAEFVIGHIIVADDEDNQNPEGVIELLSHCDDRASRIVSAFVVCDCDDETKAQREEHLRSCVDAASGVCSPEAAVFH